MTAFRQYFVKTDVFPVQDSHAYGEAFELRNVTGYEILGKADGTQAHTTVENATRFVERCETYLITKGYL